ncbi:hypothetical protein VTJ49DRAFT_3529 [Mycothermus thermophilus]|uniref:Hydrophobin n=1 Tax=Humicola insolens TaxID=85995 RepID=A0ABR3V7E4_HUMIN
MQFRNIVTVLALAMTATALPATTTDNQAGAEIVARTGGGNSNNNNNNNPHQSCSVNQFSVCCNQLKKTLNLGIPILDNLLCTVTGVVGGLAGTCNGGKAYCCNGGNGNVFKVRQDPSTEQKGIRRHVANLGLPSGRPRQHQRSQLRRHPLSEPRSFEPAWRVGRGE